MVGDQRRAPRRPPRAPESSAHLGQRRPLDHPEQPLLGELLPLLAGARDPSCVRSFHGVATVDGGPVVIAGGGRRRRRSATRLRALLQLRRRSSAAPDHYTRRRLGRRGRDQAAGGAGGPAPGGGDHIIGATLEGLRRAAEEVEHVAAVAETLQRSLLPERLPELSGLTMSARYVAGSADAQVGGDWYDVIALRDGQAGIAIGDVVGHGLDAAARMARLQNALRAYALEGLRPSLVLERMNGFAREVSGGPMATVLYGVIDPEEGAAAPGDRRPPAGARRSARRAMPTSPRARPAARSA